MAVRHVTEQTFESTVKEGIVLLDWWAAWCGPCRRFGPIFEEAAGKHPDVVFGKIDTEDQPRLAETYEIRSIPTVMAFRDGLLLFSQPGLLSAAQLDEVIAKLRGLDMAEIHRQVAKDQETTPA
jgi:thioredoxin 1